MRNPLSVNIQGGPNLSGNDKSRFMQTMGYEFVLSSPTFAYFSTGVH